MPPLQFHRLRLTLHQTVRHFGPTQAIAACTSNEAICSGWGESRNTLDSSTTAAGSNSRLQRRARRTIQLWLDRQCAKHGAFRDLSIPPRTRSAAGTG